MVVVHAKIIFPHLGILHILGCLTLPESWWCTFTYYTNNWSCWKMLALDSLNSICPNGSCTVQSCLESTYSFDQGITLFVY